LEPAGFWGLEIKWDGARTISYLDGTGLRLLTRNGNVVTARYPELAELRELLGNRTAILDGEVIATDASGRPSFSRLQERMMLSRPTTIRTVAARVPVTLMLFDVLWLDRSLTGLTYRGRREVLESLPLDGARIVVPPAWPGTDAEQDLAFTRDHGLEGLIAKRLASTYAAGIRSRDWIKLKNVRLLDVTVVGWVPTGKTVKALLLGVPDDGGAAVCRRGRHGLLRCGAPGPGRAAGAPGLACLAADLRPVPRSRAAGALGATRDPRRSRIP
jgi:bifunctional non-homologous end joining protein LigD